MNYRARFFVALGSVIAYVLCFEPAHSAVGSIVGVLTIFPAAVVGWLLGSRAGLLFGLLSAPLNILLYAWAADPLANQLAPFVLSSMVWSGIGSAVGWGKELLDQVRQQARQLEHERENLQEEITKRKRAEEALQRANENLETTVTERTSQLQIELAERKRTEEVQLHQTEYLSALHDTTLGLVSRRDVEDLLEVIITRAAALVGTEHGFVYLLEPGKREMEMRIGIGAYADLVGSRIQPGAGLTGTVWETGQPLLVDDYRTWAGRLADPRRDLMHAVVGVPLKSGEAVIGVIGLAYLEAGRQFGPAELEALNRFADLASLAWDNANSFRQTQDTLTWQQALYRTSEMIGKATTIEGIVRGAAELMLLLEMSHCTTITITAVDPEGVPIRGNLYTVRFEDNEFTLLPNAIGKPIAGWLPSDSVYYSELRVTVFPDLKDPSTTVPQDYLRPTGAIAFMLRQGLRGAVTMGLGAHGRKLGYLTFCSPSPLARPPEEYIERLRNVIDLVSTAVDNLVLLQQTQDALSWQQALYRASEMIGKATTIEGIVRGAAELIPVLEMFSCSATLITEVDAEGVPIRGDLYIVRFDNNEFTLLPNAIGKPIAGGLPSDSVYYSELRITVLPDLKDPSTTVPQDHLVPTGSVAFMLRQGLRGAVALALGVHGRRLGYLTFCSPSPLTRPPEEYVERLRNIVDLVSTAVDNLQLLQQTQQRAVELATANQYLEAVNETATGLTGRLDLNALLEDVVRRAGTLLGTEHGFVYLLRPGESEMEMRVGIGAYADLVGSRTQPGMGLTGTVWKTGQPLVVEDYSTWPGRLTDPRRDIVHAVVGVPLKSGEAVIGGIGLAYLEAGRQFGPAELDALTRFAALASLALDNADLFRQTQDTLAWQETLYRASEMIGKATTIEDIVCGAAELGPSLEMTGCFINLITKEDPNGLPIQGDNYAVSFKNDEFIMMSPRLGVPIPSWLPGAHDPSARQRVTVFPDLEDPATTVPEGVRLPAGSLASLRSADVRSMVSVGLRVRGRMLGYLTYSGQRPLSRSPKYYSQWLRNIADLVSTAVDNMQLFQQAQRELEERKRAQEQLVHSALHDPLTGLPNRTLFMDRLERAMERAKRHKEHLYAVLYMDFDRFKVVNDSLGHAIGDLLLIESARRLLVCVRAEDTVARLGGDEFVILLEDVQDITDTAHITNRILNDLASPYTLEGQKVFISASIGIVLSTTGYDRSEDILRDADIAMYRAKALGRGRYEVFDAAMRERAIALMGLETDLRRALERQEFSIHYQPIVSLATNRIVGFEALARWQHPARGLVSPAEFIPLAEETGLIVPIGQWVLREACRQMREWQVQFPMNPPLTISVNFSTKQFAQPDLLQKIALILQETGLDASGLQLELTESMIVEDAESASALLSQLRTLGVHVQIDDFGTGYSSLGYLHRLPIDTLKIDRTFIGKMGLSGNGTEIVRAILELAHSLGMKVIAEGVETANQLVKLKGLDCEYGQGYLFAKPADGKAAEALIEESFASR